MARLRLEDWMQARPLPLEMTGGRMAVVTVSGFAIIDGGGKVQPAEMSLGDARGLHWWLSKILVETIRPEGGDVEPNPRTVASQ